MPPKAKENCSEKSNEWFFVKVYFAETTYKEIRQVRAYDIDSMFGNISGFIGLILGCSVVQFPDFVHNLWYGISGRLDERMAKQRNMELKSKAAKKNCRKIKRGQMNKE